MSLNANNSKNNKGPKVDPVDPGTYPARVVLIADLGLQEQRPFKGEAKEPAYEILLTYELLDEFMKDEEGKDLTDKPRWQSESFALYGLSSERAKSTKRYISLDPDMRYGGDWAKLIDTPCMLTLVENAGQGKNAGKTFTNIANVAAMRPKDALRAPSLVNEAILFDLDNPSVEAFKALPAWIQKKIVNNLEFKGSKLAGLLANNPVEVDEPEVEDTEENPF